MNRATVLTLVQRAIREVRDLALASLALIAGLFTRLLPERAVVSAVGYLGRRVGMLIPRYVRIGRRNLTLAYPDKTPEERDAILRDSWEMLDARDTPIGKVEEDSMAMAMLRRLLSNLVPQRFQLQTGNGTQATFRQRWNPFVFSLEVATPPGAAVDPRLVFGAAVLLAAIEGRQGN